MTFSRTGLWLAICAIQLGQAFGQASDWLHCRGPAYDGHAPTNRIRLPWPAEGPRVLWRKTLGEGYSGIVADGLRIYSQIQTLGGQYLLCLDLETGEEKWRTRYNWPWQPDSEWPGPYGTPTLANGRVYFTDCFGSVLCADATSGRLLWNVNLTERFGIEPPAFGYAITPLVFEGNVIVPVGGKGHAVVAFDAKTGAIAWQTGDESPNYSSCIAISVAGAPQVVAYLERSATGFEPQSGHQLWRYEWDQQYGPHGTWPLYQEPYLFYALPFRFGSHALDLRDTNAQRPRVVWTNNVISMDLLSGVVVDGFIYGFDVRDFQTSRDRPTKGGFKCVELATGREQWSTPAPGHASVLACGRSLLLLSEAGELIAAEASPTSYRELARARIFPRQTCWTAPALCGNRLVARCHQEFVCLDLGTQPGAVVSANDTTRTTPSRHLEAGDWFVRHRGPVFHMPTWRDEVRWFLASLLGVFAPALVIAALLSKAVAGQRAVFYGAGFMLSICGTWVWTEAVGIFVLTWPATLFLALALALEARAWAAERPAPLPRLAARIVLAGFVVAVAGYWWLCRSLFLIAGQSFLTGLLPAVPLTAWAVNVARRQGSRAASLAIGSLAFAVYFWTSATVLWWRTR